MPQALGVNLGWDNSNILGVDDATAATAATATKGFEFEIDMASFFGATPQGVNIAAFITGGDGGFISSQVLPGVNGGNVGSPNPDGATIGTVAVRVPRALDDGARRDRRGARGAGLPPEDKRRRASRSDGGRPLRRRLSMPSLDAMDQKMHHGATENGTSAGSRPPSARDAIPISSVPSVTQWWIFS